MRKLIIGLSCCLLLSMATTGYAGPAEGTYFSSGVTNTTPDPAAYGTVVRPIANDGSTVAAIADVTVTSTATAVKAATANRAVLSCTNTSASVHVRWGDATVTATKGQQVRAGKAVEIRNIGAIYMISEGANVTITCTEELR